MGGFLMILLLLLAVICFEAMAIASLYSDNKRLRADAKNQKEQQP